jgi:hypothetical protein
VLFEKADKEKLPGYQAATLGKISAKDPVRNIIDFESGRKAFEKAGLHDERDPARLVEPNRLSCRLSFDWLELLLTMVLLAGLLLAVVGWLIASWWFWPVLSAGSL